MGIFDKLFRRWRNNRRSDHASERKYLPTLEEFPLLTPEARMSIIISLGDSGRLEFFPFLKLAVLKDADQHVKFAALKRIHHFKKHPDTIPMLMELKNNGDGQNYEPYFSMAMSRMGLMSMNEFNKMIDNPRR